MDPVSLAATITGFLAPLLPYLLKGSEKAAEEVSKKFGGAVWDRATVLWDRLWPRLEVKPAAQEAVQELVKAPEDQAVQGALNLQVRKILAEDGSLAQVLTHWLEEARSAGVNITIASGDRSVSVGRSVMGSTIITGDDNK